ncbi:PAS domain-containing sensor histidine kinase [Paenibacillus lupini]|uniref:PAS domain-containing sensor histidine kinase n=1 Tax=Paenibacillus lupini TaxID=1450204 RepID=UPI001FBBE538|nr:PAS domain-containing sensor histidine kinase [Paenibacillus lupini]
MWNSLKSDHFDFEKVENIRMDKHGHIMKHSFMESIWKNIPDGIVVIDLDENVLDVNPGFEALHGWSREELIGKPCCFTPVHLLEERRIMIEKVKQGDSLREQETFKLRKDGTLVYISLTITALKDEIGQLIGLVGIERDISDRIKMEASLFEAESLYSHLADSALAGVFVGQDGRILYANPYLSALYGYTNEEMLQVDMAQLMMPGELEKVVRDAEKTLIEQKQIYYHFNITGVKKDGSPVHLEGNSCLISFQGRSALLGTVQDITVKKQRERSLRDNANMYQRIIKFLPEPIVLIDNGEIVYANKLAVKLIGAVDDTEMVGRPILDYVDPAYSRDLMDVLNKVIHTDDPTIFIENKLLCKDGQSIDVEMSSIRIHNYRGKMVILTVIRDLTDRKRSEEMLVRSEKLSVIGQLAAGVAHEIRNPLTALKGFTQLLKSKAEGNSFYYDIMTNELDRINFIVNEFMTLAKPHFSKFSTRRLDHILHAVISILETQAILMNVSIRTEFENCIPSIYCDENQLKQVFINIIKNAIEAMPLGGQITISVAMEPDQEKVRLTIRDEGMGIPDTIIRQIGQPFITTKEKGTGLGLMISSRIIEAHHGLMNISSVPDEGTTIEIILPLNMEEQ